MPVLEYLVTKTEANSIKSKSVFIMFYNGHEARGLEIIRPLDEESEIFIEEHMVQLWESAEAVPLQQYRAAVQRALDPLINNTINAIYGAFMSQAEPSASDIFAAAEAVLANTPKMQEWNRLNIMFQSMTEAEFRRFLALSITITMSKSARG
jgi:hypothetical protein